MLSVIIWVYYQFNIINLKHWKEEITCATRTKEWKKEVIIKFVKVS